MKDNKRETNKSNRGRQKGDRWRAIATTGGGRKKIRKVKGKDRATKEKVDL